MTGFEILKSVNAMDTSNFLFIIVGSISILKKKKREKLKKFLYAWVILIIQQGTYNPVYESVVEHVQIDRFRVSVSTPIPR